VQAYLKIYFFLKLEKNDATILLFVVVKYVLGQAPSRAPSGTHSPTTEHRQICGTDALSFFGYRLLKRGACLLRSLSRWF